MKVVQIIYSGIGGVGSVAFELIEGDIHKQWRSVFLFLGVEKIFPGFKTKCKNLNIKFYLYDNVRNYLFKEIFVFLKLIKERPNIIISHNANIFSLILYKYIFSIKVLYVDHTPFFYRNFKNKLIDIFINFFIDKVIYVNQAFKRKSTLVIRKKKEFINNGISTPLNKKKNKKIRGIFKIGMLSRFSKGKRQDLLIKSIYKINRKLPKIKIKLFLIGEGENLEISKKLVSELGLQKIVIFKKKLKYQDINKWLDKIDCYVHLSKDEGLSTAILKAIAFKKPVVASDNLGNSFLKNNKKQNAVLVNNNIENISNSIIKIIYNDTFRKMIIENSYKLFKKKYSNIIMFNSYNKLIKILLNE